MVYTVQCPVPDTYHPPLVYLYTKPFVSSAPSFSTYLYLTLGYIFFFLKKRANEYRIFYEDIEKEGEERENE